jgi:hypothetical protein
MAGWVARVGAFDGHISYHYIYINIMDRWIDGWLSKLANISGFVCMYFFLFMDG